MVTNELSEADLSRVCGGAGPLSRIGTRATGAADEIVGRNGIIQDIQLPRPWATVKDGKMNFTLGGKLHSLPIINIGP
jgi:hypothetical protein